jgi:hypothetical protein
MKLNGLNVGLKEALAVKTASIWSPLVARYPHRSSRRFQAYAIGTPRSGTHSIDGLMAQHNRSSHEPEAFSTMLYLIRYLDGAYTDGEMVSLLRARDRLLTLEMEASHYLHHVIHLLVDAFPKAKFVLTIREPYAWLESEISRNMLTSRMPAWRALEERRYRPYSSPFGEGDARLAGLDNVRSVVTYLRYWRDHNEKVLAAVPGERLLIVRTNQLSQEYGRLADFLGISSQALDAEGAHRGLRLGPQFSLADYADEGFIRRSIETECGPLVKRFF